MSPEQLQDEIATERRLDIHASIRARCTGCGRGYTSTGPGHECEQCGETVEPWEGENPALRRTIA